MTTPSDLMKEEFSVLSILENGTFKTSNFVHSLTFGARGFQSTYHLSFKYRGEKITINNLLGSQSYGEVIVELSDTKDNMNFSIETKSSFISLFSLKKGRFNIQSKNNELKSFLNTNSQLKTLHAIIEDTQFEPNFYGEKTKNGYLLKTEYHLQFPERSEVLQPLIDFYKALIDELKT